MTAPLDLPAIRARLDAQKPDPLLLSRVTQHAFRAGFSAALSRIDLTAGAIDLWMNYEPNELDYSRMKAVLGNAADTRALLAEVEALREALEEIAKPKTGPGFDWSEYEALRWRARWRNRYEEIARVALTGGNYG